MERRLIEQERLQADDAEFVRSQLDYLRNKVDAFDPGRITRKDLVLLLIGCTVSICSGLGLPGATAAELYRAVVLGLQQVFDHLLAAVPIVLRLGGGPTA